MASLFPKVYQSFDDFERNELRSLDTLYGSVDDMVDELLMSEMEDEEEAQHYDDGILFDRIDD